MTTFGYQLRRVSGPEIEPVSLNLARTQCKLDADLTSEDELLTLFIQAAREISEDFCKRTWCESVWEMSLSEFPSDDGLRLPMGPVIDVLGLSYLDSQGTRVEVLDYASTLDTTPAYLYPAAGTFWPSVQCAPGSVVVQYRAGYQGVGSPPDASAVPAAVKKSILSMVAYWFEHREEATEGTVETLPFGWEFALQPFRVYP